MKTFLSILCVLVIALAGNGLHAQAPSYPGEKEWLHILDLKKQLSADAPPGVNEVDFSAPVEAELHRAVIDYTNTFPDSPNLDEARLLALKTVAFPASVEQRRAIFAGQEKLLDTLTHSTVPPLVRKEAERTVLRQYLDHLDLITQPEDAAKLEARLASYVTRFPADPKIGALQVRRVDLLEMVNPTVAAALLAGLAASDDPAVAAAAKGRQERQALLAAPLDWKFTAVDGSAVDLTQWRGKYVLVEFWASWCPDCLRETPDVLAAFSKYHEKGLDVVGVSLDHDKDALIGFLKKHRVPWPQMYDGKGWEAEVPVRYGVKGIPEIWLVDKEGKVVASGLHGSQLDAKLAPLFGS